MINTANPVFYEAPEPINRVGVNVAHNIHLGTVIDALVSVASSLENRVVRWKFIGKTVLWGMTYSRIVLHSVAAVVS